LLAFSQGFLFFLYLLKKYGIEMKNDESMKKRIERCGKWEGKIKARDKQENEYKDTFPKKYYKI
jgi:hypothetical protein